MLGIGGEWEAYRANVQSLELGIDATHVKIGFS